MFDKSLKTVLFLILLILTIVEGLFLKIIQVTFLIPLWILILLGLVIIYLGLIVIKTKKKDDEFENSESQTESVPNSKRKSIPNEFKIDSIQVEQYEWSVIVKRSWLPTNKPDSDDFTKSLSLNKPICKFCCSELIEVGHRRRIGSQLYLECPSKDCDGYKPEPFKIYTMNKIGERELKIFKGIVRKDFDKYWETYVKIYDKFTDKKYDDFWEPF